MEWDARKVHAYQTLCLCLISTILSFLVLLLSIKLAETKLKPLGNYAKIVAFNTCLDIWYIITLFVNMPAVIEYKGVLFIINENPLLKDMNFFYGNAVMLLFTNSIILLALCHMIHFWYRYEVFCKTTTWSQTRYLATYFGFCIWIVVEYTFACLVTDDFQPYLEMLKEIDWYKGDVPPFTMFGWSFISATKLLHFQLIISIFYGMVGYFGLKTWRQLKHRHFQVSPHVLTAQKAILKTMIMQALYPLITFCLPCGVVFFSAFVHVNMISIGYLLSFTSNLIPILNSLSVLTLIPSYRRMVLRMFRCSNNSKKIMVKGSSPISRRTTYLT